MYQTWDQKITCTLKKKKKSPNVHMDWIKGKAERITKGMGKTTEHKMAQQC